MIGEKQECIDVKKLREEIMINIRKAQEAQKTQFDKHRKEAKQFKTGDLVLERISSVVAGGKSRNLRSKYKGPFRVKEVLPHDQYKIEGINSGAVSYTHLTLPTIYSV